MPSSPPAFVSVIIPFLDGGNWLAEAIESVISQTFTQWEAILIDDGSEDETTSIARQFANKFPEKIIYIDHPGHVNRGVTVSRNVGINSSKGSYIAFLDADDKWLEDKLYNQLKLFKQYPEAAMICEASYFWYSWNNNDKKDEVVSIGAKPGLYRAMQLTKILYPLGNGQPPCPTGIIVKREAFNRSGGFEESFTGVYQLYEDQAFLSKIYLHENVYVSEIPNNFYRKREGSLTGSAEDEEHYKKVRRYFLEWLQQYVIEQSVKDEMILQLIQSALTRIIN